MKNMKLITIILTLLVLPTLVYSLQEVLVLNLEVHKDGKIILIDFYLDQGEESVELTENITDYRIEVLSKDNKLLYSKYFKPLFEIHVDVLPGEVPSQGTISINKTNIILKIPYLVDTRIIKLFYKNELFLEQEINFCNNNNICEPARKENLLSCPKDCKSGSKDNYCDGIFDGKCDQDCVDQGRAEKDVDCTCGNNVCDVRESVVTCPKDCKKSQNSFIYLIILATLIMILLFLFRFKKKWK